MRRSRGGRTGRWSEWGQSALLQVRVPRLGLLQDGSLGSASFQRASLYGVHRRLSASWQEDRLRLRTDSALQILKARVRAKKVPGRFHFDQSKVSGALHGSL
jgi:hypothetical protein